MNSRWISVFINDYYSSLLLDIQNEQLTIAIISAHGLKRKHKTEQSMDDDKNN